MTTLTEQLANVREALADLRNATEDELSVRVLSDWGRREALIAATHYVDRDVIACGLRAMEALLVSLVEQEVTA